MTLPAWARLRLLPLTIGFIGLALVARVEALLQGPALIKSASEAVLPSARAAAQEGTPAKPAGGKAPIEGKSPASAAVPSKPEVTKEPAVPAPSEAELALLSDLRARKKVLDERAAALDARDGLLAAAEHRLSERLDQLTALQTKLEQLDQTRRERDEANWRSMVKTYETMRPRDAAAIFNDLDQAVMLQVLDRMKEAKAGAILAAMQPERARLATTELAKWRTRTPDGTQP